jgi:hypothetical protein
VQCLVAHLHDLSSQILDLPLPFQTRDLSDLMRTPTRNNHSPRLLPHAHPLLQPFVVNDLNSPELDFRFAVGGIGGESPSVPVHIARFCCVPNLSRLCVVCSIVQNNNRSSLVKHRTRATSNACSHCACHGRAAMLCCDVQELCRWRPCQISSFQTPWSRSKHVLMCGRVFCFGCVW